MSPPAYASHSPANATHFPISSLVSPGKRVESGWLWRGNPARPVRELSVKERDYFRYSAEHYIKLKDQYLEQAEDYS